MFESKTLLSELALNHKHHAFTEDWYVEFSRKIDQEVSISHTNSSTAPVTLGEIGNFLFPFFSMGNVNSSNLFGLDELILFSFYYQNRNRYSRVLDLGANIGLHTLVLLKMGYSVTSVEPDPNHHSQIYSILKLNQIDKFKVIEAAASTVDGHAAFVRVLGNTTGSHLLGSKPNEPYGGHETFNVEVKDIITILSGKFDLVKMDVEGHEATLIEHLKQEQFSNTDFILEIGTSENAEFIYNKASSLGLNMFSQKLNWRQVREVLDLPTSYKEGSVFITANEEMNWR
jgi:FkbM family methyltransferase